LGRNQGKEYILQKPVSRCQVRAGFPSTKRAVRFLSSSVISNIESGQKSYKNASSSKQDLDSNLLKQLIDILDMWQVNVLEFIEVCKVKNIPTDPKSRDNDTLSHLMEKKRAFNKKGYVITPDNYLKMLKIYQFASLQVPIVIMGATGCGKTYMFDFMVNFILKEDFECVTLNAGYTEQDLERDLLRIVEKCRNNIKIWRKKETEKNRGMTEESSQREFCSSSLGLVRRVQHKCSSVSHR
jgi:chromosomal replication initiation ATPase DnaA